MISAIADHPTMEIDLAQMVIEMRQRMYQVITGGHGVIKYFFRVFSFHRFRRQRTDGVGNNRRGVIQTEKHIGFRKIFTAELYGPVSYIITSTQHRPDIVLQITQQVQA